MFQQLAAAGFWPQNFELTSMIQVLVGGLLGLAVGIERSRRQKEAGKATHFVVGAASTLLTCISLWFKENGNYGDEAYIIRITPTVDGVSTDYTLFDQFYNE